MKLAALIGVFLLAACAPQAPAPALEGQIPMGQESGAEQGSSADQDPNVEQEPNMEVEQVVLPNLGPAPELQNEKWLNTNGPLRLADLRGSVVLLDMWTFG